MQFAERIDPLTPTELLRDKNRSPRASLFFASANGVIQRGIYSESSLKTGLNLMIFFFLTKN